MPEGTGTSAANVLSVSTEHLGNQFRSGASSIVQRVDPANFPTRARHVTFNIPQHDKYKKYSSENLYPGLRNIGEKEFVSSVDESMKRVGWHPNNTFSKFITPDIIKKFKEAKNDAERNVFIKDLYNFVKPANQPSVSSTEPISTLQYSFLKKILNQAVFNDSMPSNQKMTDDHLDELYKISNYDLMPYVDKKYELVKKAADLPWDELKNNSAAKTAIDRLLLQRPFGFEAPGLKERLADIRKYKDHPYSSAEKQMIELSEKPDLSNEQLQRLAEFNDKNPQIPQIESRILSEYIIRGQPEGGRLTNPNPERLEYTTSEIFNPFVYQGERVAPFGPHILEAHRQMVEGTPAQGNVPAQPSLATAQRQFGETQAKNIKELSDLLKKEVTDKKTPPDVYASHEGEMRGEKLEKQPISQEAALKRFEKDYGEDPHYKRAIDRAKQYIASYQEQSMKDFAQHVLPQISGNYYRLGAYNTPQRIAAEENVAKKFKKDLDKNSLEYLLQSAKEAENFIHRRNESQTHLAQQLQQAHKEHREHQMVLHAEEQKARREGRQLAASRTDLANAAEQARLEGQQREAQTLLNVGVHQQQQAQNERDKQMERSNEEATHAGNILAQAAAINANIPYAPLQFQSRAVVPPQGINQPMLQAGRNLGVASALMNLVQPQPQQPQYPTQQPQGFAGGGHVSSSPHYAAYMDQLRAYKKAADFYGQTPPQTSPWTQGIGDMAAAFLEAAGGSRPAGVVLGEGVRKANERHQKARDAQEAHRVRSMTLANHLTERFGDMFKNIETAQKGRDENEETRRHHISSEGLTGRQLDELGRHHQAAESFSNRQLDELVRHHQESERSALAKASAPRVKEMSDKDRKELLQNLDAQFEVMGVNAAAHAIAPFMPRPETAQNKTWHSITGFLGASPSFDQLADIDSLESQLVAAKVATTSGGQQRLKSTQELMARQKFGKDKSATTNLKMTSTGFKLAEDAIKGMIPQLKRAGYSDDEIQDMIKDGYEKAQDIATTRIQGYEKLSKFNDKEKASWNAHLDKAGDLWKNSKLAKVANLFSDDVAQDDISEAERESLGRSAHSILSGGQDPRSPVADIYRHRMIDYFNTAQPRIRG